MNATLVASLPKDVQSLKIVTMYEIPRECRISLRFLHSAFAFCAHERLTPCAAVRHSRLTQAVALDAANMRPDGLRPRQWEGAFQFRELESERQLIVWLSMA